MGTQETKVMMNHSKAVSTLYAALLMFVAVPVTAGEKADGFEMTVIQDSAYGAEIVSGELDLAIAKIHAREYTRKRDAFPVSNNLCVALALKQEFEKAAAECEKAIAVSKERIEMEESQGYAATSRNYAMALTNRGVLRLLQGEPELATEDFENARQLRSVIGAPRRNLQYLAARSE